MTDANVPSAAPYQALAAVYDRWTGSNDYARWAAFADARIRGRAGTALVDPTLLDLCCGTGSMSAALGARGYRATGIDQSEEMLAHARQAAPEARFLCGELPNVDLGKVGSGYDAAVCAFDSINYFVENGALDRLFAFVAGALRPGGVFVFDVNTRHKLERVFGASHYGDDFGDFAYVWRNRLHPDVPGTEFLITLFTRTDEGFRREQERHVQRWFTDAELNGSEHGFAVLGVTDDYTDAPAHETTLRQTWVLQRVDEKPV